MTADAILYCFINSLFPILCRWDAGMTDRQRNETEQALHLLNRVLTLNSHHREALNLMHWLQAEKKSDDVAVQATGVDGIANGRPINHYRNTEGAAIGSLPAVHHPPTTTSTLPSAGHWITANRLQQHQQPPTQREESRQQQHRSGTTSSNYRWNKTAKN